MRHSINCNESVEFVMTRRCGTCVRLMLSGCLDPVWTGSTDVLLKGSFTCKLASWCCGWWGRTQYYQEVIGCTTSHCANMTIISAPKVMCLVEFVQVSNNTTSASNYVCQFHKVNYNEIISKNLRFVVSVEISQNTDDHDDFMFNWANKSASNTNRIE